MPLLQKVKFSSGRKDRFIHYTQNQLYQTEGDREDLERKWSDAILQHRASLVGDGTVDHPFVGASSIELPLTDIHFQPVYADLSQTLHAPEDYWTPVARRPDTVDAVNSVREGLSAVERRFLNMKAVNRRAFMDTILLGTGVYKCHWRATRKTVKDYDPGGSGRIVDRLVTKSEPAIDHLPLQRFWFPANAWNVDADAQGGAQWVAQEYFLRPNQLKEMAAGGGSLPPFDKKALDKVLKFVVDETPDVDETQREEDDFEPFENQRIRFFEVWARFDVNGDGVEEDIVAHVHPESLTLLRALHNPFLHGRRPFHVTNYLPSFGILGIGLAEIDEWAQETSTKLLNAQIDNILLANTRMYAAPMGSNIQPGESVYPGKIWFVGPQEEVGEIKMSEVYPSIFQGLSQMMQFAEMRTGVSEIRQGNLTGLPSRTPATSLLSILREGNKRFDMILSGIRDVHSDMGMRMMQNVSQHVRSPEDALRWRKFFVQALREKDAQMVLEVLSRPAHEIEEAFGMTVTATSAQVNKEVEKQAFIGLLQIVGQVGAQLVQVGQLAEQSPPGITQETSAALYSGGVELLKQLLARFDIQNPQEYLGNMETIAAALNAQNAGGNAATASLGGSLGALGQPAMDIPPQLLAQQQLGALAGF